MGTITVVHNFRKQINSFGISSWRFHEVSCKIMGITVLWKEIMDWEDFQSVSISDELLNTCIFFKFWEENYSNILPFSCHYTNNYAITQAIATILFSLDFVMYLRRHHLKIVLSYDFKTNKTFRKRSVVMAFCRIEVQWI